MTVGKIGHLHTVPKPSAETMTEALNLMAAMGGAPKKVEALLVEMREVQTANQAVVVEGRELISEIKREQDKLDKEREQHARDTENSSNVMAQQNRELITRRDNLSKRATEFDRHEVATNAAQAERSGELETGKRDLAAKVSAWEKTNEGLAARVAEVEKREQSNQVLFERFKRRDAKLRAVLDERD